MAKKKAAKQRATKAAPLLQYLVLLQQSMDDIPVLLTDNHDEAMLTAMSAPEDGRAPRMIVAALGINETSPCCVSIITLRNGVPVNREIVREYQ